MEENNKGVPFFKRVKWSIFNPENYELFAVENTKVTLKYFVTLLLIFSLLIAIGVTYKFATTDLRNMPELNGYLSEELIKSIESMAPIQLYAMFYGISIVYIFAMYFVIIAIDILILSILGFLTSRLAKAFLKYSAIINISVYALTLPIILNMIYILVRCFTNFEIKYFQIMYNAVAYIYVVTAILMIKSELIKQEAELAKIEEEQKKVKEELERQQEEEKQKEEQRRKEREEEKKKKEKGKKQKEKKEKGDTPEGSMAIRIKDKCNDNNCS